MRKFITQPAGPPILQHDPANFRAEGAVETTAKWIDGFLGAQIVAAGTGSGPGQNDEMKEPSYDEDGSDGETFAPFILNNCLDTEWKDVRLVFGDWDWFEEKYGSEVIDGYYFNGYGI